MNGKLKRKINKCNKKIESKNIKQFYSSHKIYLIPLLFLLLIAFNKINSLDDNFDNDLIKVGYYCNSIKYGGVERVISLIINLLSQEKIFSHYLLTKTDILEEEYPLPNNTKRIRLVGKRASLFWVIKKKDIDILIYNSYDKREIKKLNKLKDIKIIYYDHSSFLYWIYLKAYNFKDTIYYEYKKCKYVISLIPVESDYLFKKWGINSILMHNPTSFEYDDIIPSDLLSNNIIMMGRNDDPVKRFDLGIKAMKRIIKEIPRCKMNILSLKIEKYEKLIQELKLEDNVRFVGFQKNVDIYLKNTSLHILPSLSECYPMVLSETKIFGIPSILIGLDHLALAKGGTVIIYDDNPDIIAKEAIKILKNYNYRKILGNEARESMKPIKNNLIAKQWAELLKIVYKGDEQSYKILSSNNKDKIKDEEANKILNNQLQLLQKRNPYFKKITLDKFKQYSFQ